MDRRRRATLGRQAELQALNYLQANGLELVQRNFHSRFGEIDLVMTDADCLVFVEVRYRNSNHYATAAESVDRHKRRKLVLAASFYLRCDKQRANWPVRFDVVALDQSASGDQQLTWLRDAFRPGD